jgi:hypothetical protein
MGLAMGMDSGKIGIGQEFISASEVLSKIGEEPEPETTQKRRRKRDNISLPMPKVKA